MACAPATAWAASGQLIDRLAFVACADTRIDNAIGNAAGGSGRRWSPPRRIPTSISMPIARLMGEKLVVRPGSEVVVAIVVRDPSGTNYSPYTFANPSLAQVGITQPLNKPVLDHIDVIGGAVTGYKVPGAADYAGQWPSDWISNPDLANVPEGAKNTTARTSAHVRPGHLEQRARRQAVQGDGVPPARLDAVAVPAPAWHEPAGCGAFETDADGNPLADCGPTPRRSTRRCRAARTACPRMPTCASLANGWDEHSRHRVTYTGTAIDGCPAHLPVVDGRSTRPTTWRPGRTCGSTAIRSSSK